MLKDTERRAVNELKKLVEEAISSNQLMQDAVIKGDEARIALLSRDYCHGDNNTNKVSIWGVPLLEDERTDVILLKFLQHEHFRVKRSFETIKNTLRWRHKFGVDDDYNWEGANVFIKIGRDRRKGRPLCYNMLHHNFPYMTFSNEDERITKILREKFIRSWILSVERMIRELIDFRPHQINTIFQVNNLDKCSRLWLGELIDHLIPLLHHYYPRSIAKQVFINIPWLHRIRINKFRFTGVYILSNYMIPQQVCSYMSPGQIPIPYGGLWDFYESNSKSQFHAHWSASQVFLNPKSESSFGVIATRKCIAYWELRVVGWNVTYSARFDPTSKDALSVIIKEETKMKPNDDPVISGSFKIRDPGELQITIHNLTFRHRTLISRLKVLPYSD